MPYSARYLFLKALREINPADIGLIVLDIQKREGGSCTLQERVSRESRLGRSRGLAFTEALIQTGYLTDTEVEPVLREALVQCLSAESKQVQALDAFTKCHTTETIAFSTLLHDLSEDHIASLLDYMDTAGSLWRVYRAALSKQNDFGIAFVHALKVCGSLTDYSVDPLLREALVEVLSDTSREVQALDRLIVDMFMRPTKRFRFG